MKRTLARHHALAFAAAVLLAVACSDSPNAPKSSPASSIDVIDGDDQSGVVGSQLANPVAVLVTDAADKPLGNQAVSFAVTAGGGTVDRSSTVTNALGVATVRWTLGTTAETEQRLEARAVRGDGSTIVSTTIHAAAGPGAPASLVVVDWNGAGMSERMLVPIPARVRVVDQYGNAVHGVPVTFTVTAGGGTVTGANTTSGGLGFAQVGSWTLGAAGTNTLTATSGTLAPVTFTTNARSTTPARVVLSSGQNQEARVASMVPQPLAVIVQNEAGDALQGITVTFTPGPNSGNVTSATATTGPTGIATLNGWFLGNTAGPQTLVASVSPTATFTFNAKATAGPAARLAKRAGDGQVAYAGETLPIAPSVFVQDVYGNSVAGVTVNFAVYSGGGSVTGATAVSDAAGIATVGSWTLGSLPGTQTLRASSPGFASDVDFTASANSRGAVQITLNTRTPTSGPAGGEVTIYVNAVDALGFGVANVPISFAAFTSAISQGRVLDPSQNVLTNAQGVASVRYVLPTSAQAPAGVRASSPGLNTLEVYVDVVEGTESAPVMPSAMPSS